MDGGGGQHVLWRSCTFAYSSTAVTHSSMDPPLGAVVSVPAGRGIVRFCGVASFAPGKWVGIELGKAVGKNDGTINGVAYFHCKPNHGVFVRPSQVKIEESKERFSISL